MPTRKAEAKWEGKLKEGRGMVKLGSGAFEGQYSFKSRFEQGPGTNPEELIGAALAGCFSMALSLLLEKDGYNPQQIETQARVSIEQKGEGFAITHIALDTRARVPEMPATDFKEKAETAKNNCPVSKALTGTQISLTATLEE